MKVVNAPNHGLGCDAVPKLRIYIFSVTSFLILVAKLIVGNDLNELIKIQKSIIQKKIIFYNIIKYEI